MGRMSPVAEPGDKTAAADRNWADGQSWPDVSFRGVPTWICARVASIPPEGRLFSAKWPFIEGYSAADTPDPRLVYALRGPT